MCQPTPPSTHSMYPLGCTTCSLKSRRGCRQPVSCGGCNVGPTFPQPDTTIQSIPKTDSQCPSCHNGTRQRLSQDSDPSTSLVSGRSIVTSTPRRYVLSNNVVLRVDGKALVVSLQKRHPVWKTLNHPKIALDYFCSFASIGVSLFVQEQALPAEIRVFTLTSFYTLTCNREPVSQGVKVA